MPLPNDVLLVDEKRFYVTSEKPGLALQGSVPGKAVRLLSRIPSGWVVYRDEDGKASLTKSAHRVVADNFVLANGIVAAPTGRHIITVSQFGAHVHIFEKKLNGNLRLVDSIPIDICGDNVSVDPETGAIYVTGFAKLLSYAAAADDPSVVSPTTVLKITNNTSPDQFYGRKFKVTNVYTDTGAVVSGGTIALVHSGLRKTFVSGTWTKGVVVCDKAL
ncbi:hypothetical protein HK104_006799 [Borealophlyctis nickersoniae]|nr:hypothetical protein HK104_006799 [Borealophlyctis nickersoniae]